MQDICENIRTAIEHGRTDIIRSLLDACMWHKFYIQIYDLSHNVMLEMFLFEIKLRDKLHETHNIRNIKSFEVKLIKFSVILL